MDITLHPRDTDTRPSIVTVGMFDGLHLGHRFLLSTLTDLASQRDLRPVALTFARHARPATRTAPDHGLMRSNTRSDQI